MGLDGLGQFLVFLLVARVPKEHVEHSQSVFIRSQFVEQLRMNPAVPQTRCLVELHIRRLIHFNDDNVVRNNLGTEGKRQIIAQVNQTFPDPKRGQCQPDQDGENGAGQTPAKVAG